MINTLKTVEMFPSQLDTLKLLPGIDTLYFFVVTNDDYDDLYIDILQQLDEQKGAFQRREIPYKNDDIILTMNGQTFFYNGFSQGYHWMTAKNDFFRLGLKDKYKQCHMNNIQVQCQAVGIYTLGITSLLELIKQILDPVAIDHNYPLTRIDLNLFIQADLGGIDNGWFATRKRDFKRYIKEYGGRYVTQSLYIGKRPFMMRLYDKRQEMKISDKEDLMKEYFLNQDFSMDEPIFNLEFECHREHLKRAYNILSVPQALECAQAIFHDCMEAIRMIDPSLVTPKDIVNNTVSRFPTLPFWKRLKEGYDLSSFMMIQSPVQRIRRKSYLYSPEKAFEEFKTLWRKATIHQVFIDDDFLKRVETAVIQEFQKPLKPAQALYIPIDVINAKGEVISMRRMGDMVYEPVKTVCFASLADYQLKEEILFLERQLWHEDDPMIFAPLIKKLEIARWEAEQRGLDIQSYHVYPHEGSSYDN